MWTVAQPHALLTVLLTAPSKRRCLSGDCSLLPKGGCPANLASPTSPTSPTSSTSLTSLARQDEGELLWVLWPGRWFHGC